MNNNDEICLNDVVMEEKYRIQPSLQIEESINANEVKEKMKDFFF